MNEFVLAGVLREARLEGARLELVVEGRGGLHSVWALGRPLAATLAERLRVGREVLVRGRLAHRAGKARTFLNPVVKEVLEGAALPQVNEVRLTGRIAFAPRRAGPVWRVNVVTGRGSRACFVPLVVDADPAVQAGDVVYVAGALATHYWVGDSGRLQRWPHVRVHALHRVSLPSAEPREAGVEEVV